MKVFSKHITIIKRTVIKSLKWVVYVFSGIVLAVLLLFLAMQTGCMREVAVNTLNSILKDKDIRIEVSNIKGLFPFRFELSELSIHDGLGKWMYVRDFSISIDPVKLFLGRVRIKNFYVDQAEIQRLPVKNDTAPDRIPNNFMPPAFLSWVTIENIQVPVIYLGESFLGTPSQYRLSGGITNTAALEIRELNLKIERSDGYAGSLVISALINSITGYMSAKISVQEPGHGLLYRFTGIGEDFRLSIEGEGLLNNWKGRLHASGRDIGEVTSGIYIEAAENYTFDISGEFLPDKDLIPQNYCDLSEKAVGFKIYAGFADKEIVLKLLEIEAGDIKAGFSGNISFNDLETEGNFSLIINDASCLEQLAGGYSARSLSIQGSVKGHLFRPDFDLSYGISGFGSEFFSVSQINGKAQLNPTSEGITGISVSGSTGDFLINASGHEYRDKKIEYSFNLMRNPQGKWEARRLKAESGGLSAVASGYIDLEERFISLTGKLGIRDLDIISGHMKKKIRGAVQMDFSVQGNNDNLEIEADASISPFEWEGINCDSVSIKAGITHRKDIDSGKIFIGLITDQNKLNAGSDFLISGGDISLSNLSFTGMKTDMEGAVSYNMQKKLVNGQLNLSSNDISEISMLFGYDIKGTLTGAIVFKDELGIQGIDMRAEARNVIYKENMLEGFDLSGHLSDISGSLFYDVQISARDYLNGGMILKNVELKALGKKERAEILLRGEGIAREEFSFKSEAGISNHEGTWKLDITAMEGEYGSTPVKLVGPVELYYSSDLITFNDISFQVDTGNIKGSLNYVSGNLDGNLLVEKIPLTFLHLFGVPDLDGILDGKMRLNGAPSMPLISGDMKISRAGKRDIKNNLIPPLFLKAEYNLGNGGISGEFVLNSISGGSIRGAVNMPCDFSIYPYTLVLKETEPLKGSLKGEFDLADIPLLFDIHDQVITGRLVADFDIGGVYGSPSISGRAVFSNGSYENTGMGTILRNISANISAEKSGFIVHSITADDGSMGKVTGSGHIIFDAEKNIEYRLNMSLDSMQLAGHDMIRVVAGGNAEISGTLDNHNISGRLSVQKADLQVPEKLPAEITELEIKEINRKTEPVSEKTVVRPQKSSINFNMTVTSSGRIYINGRGLESEWRGDFKINGTAADPLLTGKLSLVRGSYNFLSRPFILTQGDVRFYGNSPPDPYFEVTGRAVNNNISAFVNLKGNMKKPVFSLYSEPALPQDEIISRILFDREISQITPVQALQLAAAINEMMGRKGFDPLAYTRNLIGIDWLQIKQSQKSPGESALSAGKYLRDNIYIEVEKGISAESGRASVTWELTPSITVDAKLGEDADTEMGINYKYDY